MRSKDPELFQKLLTAIDRRTEENGVAPSTRELAAELGVNQSTVTRYLQELKAHGDVEYSGQRSLQTRLARESRTSQLRIPVVGTIACGMPIWAEENIENYIRLPAAWFKAGEYFILRARGDSMINAGISSGDMVILRRQQTAEPGQIVAALWQDEATLKRLKADANGKCYLHPENPDYADIPLDDCLIQGVAVKVMKDLE